MDVVTARPRHVAARGPPTLIATTFTSIAGLAARVRYSTGCTRTTSQDKSDDSTLAQHDVRNGTRAWDVFEILVAERAYVDPVQQMLSGAEQDGRDGELHLVDQAGAQVLSNRGNAATQSNVETVRGVSCPLERRVNTIGYEMENRPASHLERRTGVMRQDEDRCVVGRLVTPPAFPVVIRPRSTDGPEHVSAEDPRADARESARGDIVVDACFARFRPMHLLEGARMKEPVDQFRTIDAERVLEILIRARTVTVE